MALLALSTLLLMLIFSAVEVDGEVEAEALTCPDQQQAFEGSCFEFVSLQRSFFSAQGWCERGGGHLAFIQNDETQQFLQKHLQPQLDWWLGLAPASFNLSLDSAATEGPLSWLDGSDVSYSNWFGEPVPGAGCGYISKDSGFQWGTTTNCSQEFFFICEFESGRSLACADHNATLQCGSGQVIEIDDSFYGRRTLHYCRNSHSPSQAPAQKECSWMDVVDLVSEHCHGLQVCQATADVASFGEPCPGLGSYLSVEYHCKNAGLHLLMDKLAAVFENVTLTVKWLLHPFQGNLTCTLGTGDGHTIDPYSPEGAQGTVVHQYQHAGIYTVTVECSTSEWHVTAQKTITIQEPVGEFRTIRCHSSNHSTDGENCKGLYQHDLIIQVELESGTNVSYKIQHNGTEISRSSAVRGTVPHNITLPPETLQHLGAGCHQLTLLTSNRAAAVDVWTALELCVVEPVEGLLASLASDQDFCSGSFLYINVSVRSGAPVELLFMISAANENVSETHQTLNSNHQVFNISSTSKGTLNVLVRAWNLFSVMEVDAGNVTAECQSLSETGQDEHSTGEMVRLPRGSNPEITVDPENPVIGTNSVTLGVKNLQGNDKQYTFDCPCAVTAITETFVINAACLPAPYSFSVYSLTATRSTGNPKPETATKCITVTPRTDFRLVITCSNCSPVNVRMDVNLQLQCSGCQQIVWYFEDTSSEIIKSCYSDINQKPLIKMGENVSSLTVPSSTLINAVQNIVVLVYGGYNLLLACSSKTRPTTSTTTTSPTSTTSTTVPTRFTTTRPPSPPSCTISPTVGDILSPFNITCTVQPSFCWSAPCTYCFRTSSGHYLHCGHEWAVHSLFLPLGAGSNHSVVVLITVQNGAGQRINTSVSVQVCCLQFDTAAYSVFQVYSGLYDAHHPPSVLILPLLSLLQLNASSLLSDLSQSLVSLAQSEESAKDVMVQAATPLLQAASNILKASASTENQVLLAVVGEVNSTFLDLGNYSTLIINVTTPDISLVLKLDPSEETPLQLLLGFEEYPNDTNYTAKIQLPHPGVSTEDRYTWVLDSRDLTVEVGVYFLLVRPVVEAGVNSSNTSVFITSIAAQCKYWDETKTNWSDYGCRVGPRTTPQLTQCLCTHLTFFGSSFFVMPNLVDVSRTAELFATFVNNPVVVCFVGAIFLAYLLVVIWARRKDIQDTAKVLKLTVLEDNDPLAEYRYLVNVTTGHRLGASTSSQVTVTILGSEGESEPHHLTDPDKPVFERGAVDMFLLSTPFNLGDLQSIRLWHDNSGTHPAWFVNKVMVQDLETGQKWHFLCSSWLAIDVGECTLDKVFPVATEMDLKQFSNLFFMKTAKDFRDGHIWFSVISRPPSSNFTRVQRVSCCFSLLLCTMLTNIMFWGIPTDPSEQTMDLGKIEFTWQQVMIGLQSSIIMFPINLLIVSIFRNTRPRERKPENAPKPQPKIDSTKQGKTGRVSPTDPPSPQTERQITPDTVIKDIKKIAQSLSKVLRSPMPRMDCGNMDINALLSLVEDIIRQQNRAGGEFYSDDCKKELSLSLRAVNLQEGSPERTSNEKRHLYRQYLYKQLQNVEKELKLLGPSRFSKPDGYSRAVLQVQSMKGLLEPNPFSSSSRDWYSGSSSPVEGGDSGDKKKKKCCQKGLPWWFVFVGWFLVAATSGVSAYFTMMYGLTYGKQKSISWLISMLVSFFESLFITQPVKVLGFAVFFALVLKKVDQEEYGDVPIDGNLPNSDDPDAVRFARRDSTCSFYQPPPPSNIEKMRNNMIKEQKVFGLIREILIYMGFLWMLLLVAYGQRDPNAFYLTQHIQQSFSNGISDSMTHGEVFQWANSTLLNNLFGQQPGFITDGNSKLVGNARLRQVRVQDGSCRVDRSMRNSVPDCHAPYSWDMEDLGSYGPGWNPSIDANLSKTLPTPWQYQTQSRLRAHPIWGGVAVYRGGGFVVDLGPNRENASSSLQYLFENTWLDMFTRAIFVEFTVYNANVNLFCIVTLMFETTAVGAFQYRNELQSVRLYQSTGGLHIFVMASEVVYFLFIFYYMFQQGKLMKQQKWEYFRSKWNLLDMAIIILSWSALPVFIKRTLLGNQSIEYYQNHKDEYAGFNETATADAVLGYIIAFLVLLATVKLWHLLRLNPKLHMITSTLQRAWNDISGFIVVMTIMFLAYSVACNLLYGWKLYSYRTLLNAAQTIVSLQLGIFNYEEVLDYNPVLGAFIVGSCIIFMTFVVLNLFISVILVAFSEEQIHHKPSEEEEIVDLMLMKICSLFGVKVKNQQQNDSTIANTGPSVIS
uniref:Polycystic kidney disease 1 like 2a n=1 Tax=Astyanax mexicanus TaxID=7994 RepID=A0A8B9JBS6_ASTMX